MSWSRGLSWMLFGVFLLVPLCEPTNPPNGTTATERDVVSSAPPESLENTVQTPPTSDSLLLPVDSVLQHNLERAIARHADWQDLVNEKALALGLVDLSALDHPRYAALNGTEILYAASLPKIGISADACARSTGGARLIPPELIARRSRRKPTAVQKRDSVFS